MLRLVVHSVQSLRTSCTYREEGWCPLRPNAMVLGVKGASERVHSNQLELLIREDEAQRHVQNRKKTIAGKAIITHPKRHHIMIVRYEV